MLSKNFCLKQISFKSIFLLTKKEIHHIKTQQALQAAVTDPHILWVVSLLTGKVEIIFVQHISATEHGQFKSYEIASCDSNLLNFCKWNVGVSVIY